MLLIIGAYYTYSKLERVENDQKSLLSFIPREQIELIFFSPYLTETFNQFKSQSVLAKQLENNKSFKVLTQRMAIIDSVLQQEQIVTKNEYLANYNNFQSFLYVAKHEGDEIVDTITQTINGQEVFVSLGENKLFISNTEELLKPQKEMVLSNDTLLAKVFNTTSELAFGINFSQAYSQNNFDFFKSDGNKWGWYDINFSEQDFRVNGIELVNTSKTGETEINHSYSFIPQNISTLSIVETRDLLVPAIFDSLCNCNFVKEKMDWVGSHMMTFSGQFLDENYLAIHLSNPDLIDEQLGSININKDSNNIYAITENDLDFKEIFNLDFYPNYLIVLDDYAILGINQDALNKLLYNYNNENTIVKQIDIYEYLVNRFDDKDVKHKKVEKGFLPSSEISKGISTLTRKVANEHMEIISFDYTQKINLISTSEQAAWNQQLDANITFVDLIFNHQVNDKQLVVQDESDMLYLITPAGAISWKKQLQGQVKGNIEQVDIYKNGKKQLLFNTTSHIYLLDVLGRDVNSFPVTIDSATNYINAFDYDNNGDYRFVLATKSGIVNYDKEGKPILGWNKFQPKATIQQQIRYFSISGKDYLLANDIESNVYLLSRRGDIRVPLSSTYSSTYLPVDFGNDLNTTRTVYYSSSDKSVKKHFFNNSAPIKVLYFTDSVEHFSYHSVTQSKDKQYLIFFKNRVEVFDKAGKKVEQYKLPIEKQHIKLYNNNIGVIHPIVNELHLIDTKLKDKSIFSNMTNYIIDEKNTYDRIYGVSGDNIRMIIKKRE